MFKKPDLWDDPYAWRVAHQPEAGYSIAYDTQEYLVQAILEDLLTVHFEDCAQGIPWIEFLRFIPLEAHVSRFDVKLEGATWSEKFEWLNRHRSPDKRVWCINNLQDLVLETLTSPMIEALTVMEGDYIRLIPSRTCLQTAMDIAGVWFDGYEPPKGTEILSLTPMGEAMLNELGADGMAAKLALEFEESLLMKN